MRRVYGHISCSYSIWYVSQQQSTNQASIIPTTPMMVTARRILVGFLRGETTSLVGERTVLPQPHPWSALVDILLTVLMIIWTTARDDHTMGCLLWRWLVWSALILWRSFCDSCHFARSEEIIYYFHSPRLCFPLPPAARPMKWNNNFAPTTTLNWITNSLEKLKELEGKTGYSKVYFFAAIALVFASILTLLGGAKLIVDLVGFVYPAYMSFKSIDQSNGEDTQWLTYWVVFASFSILEGMAGFIIRLIPFYYMTKAGFILWLYHPQTMGAQSIYAGVIRPVMLPYLGDSANKKSE